MIFKSKDLISHTHTVCVSVCVCARAHMRACVCACVYVCVRVYMSLKHMNIRTCPYWYWKPMSWKISVQRYIKAQYEVSRMELEPATFVHKWILSHLAKWANGWVIFYHLISCDFKSFFSYFKFQKLFLFWAAISLTFRQL